MLLPCRRVKVNGRLRYFLTVRTDGGKRKEGFNWLETLYFSSHFTPVAAVQHLYGDQTERIPCILPWPMAARQRRDSRRLQTGAAVSTTHP